MIHTKLDSIWFFQCLLVLLFYIDINECLGDHGCDQICSNMDGSYTCSCNNGYVLQTNGQSCAGKNIV